MAQPVIRVESLQDGYTRATTVFDGTARVVIDDIGLAHGAHLSVRLADTPGVYTMPASDYTKVIQPLLTSVRSPIGVFLGPGEWPAETILAVSQKAIEHYREFLARMAKYQTA
jgi:hypothetical protein